MELRIAVFVACLALISLPHVARSESAYGTLSFSPAFPTANDPITVIFTPAKGEPNWCAFQSAVGNGYVYVIAFPFDCGPVGTQNEAAIGKLAAGTYKVIWTFTDNFNGEIVPTATLVVRSVPVQVPATSPTLLLALVGFLGFVGSQALRHRGNAR